MTFTGLAMERSTMLFLWAIHGYVSHNQRVYISIFWPIRNEQKIQKATLLCLKKTEAVQHDEESDSSLSWWLCFLALEVEQSNCDGLKIRAFGGILSDAFNSFMMVSVFPRLVPSKILSDCFVISSISLCFCCFCSRPYVFCLGPQKTAKLGL